MTHSELQHRIYHYPWLEADQEDFKIKSEEVTDIIIIGAGHAGTCAARAATEKGNVEVIVVEQQAKDQQQILGVGEIGHINSKWQEAHNLEKVNVEEFVNDWQLRTNNRSNYQLIKTYAEQCGSCFDWFIDPLNHRDKNLIYPMLKNPSPNMPKMLNGIRAYPGSAVMPVAIQNKAVKLNQKIAEKNGAKIYFDTRAVRLILEDEKVSGLIVERAGEKHRIMARKAVVLAAGDYSQNKAMCQDLLTEASDLIAADTNWTGHGWDGSGIRMGMMAGGRIEPRSHAAMGGNYAFPGFQTIGSTAVLRVNCKGERYSNEGFGTHILAALAGAKQPDGMLYGIFDANILDQMTYQMPCHAVFDYCNPKKVKMLKKNMELAEVAAERGVDFDTRNSNLKKIYAAQTLAELASYIYQDENTQKTFIKTVERYNKICQQGKDEDFGKEKSLLHSISEAPYYAIGQLKDSHNPIGQSFKILVTVSGLLINQNQQVLNAVYVPIEGLYATGNNSGCRFGFQYTTSLAGQSISIAQTLGRALGYHLATD